jgi:hypothetical protein
MTLNWGPGWTTRGRWPAWFMAAATLLIGIGYVALLPPFEGFDEYGYYSSIRQVADTGTLPFYPNSVIDKNVLSYLDNGPMPWTSAKPPFESLGRMTYPGFFANAEAVARYRDYRRLPADWIFAPSSAGNWEAQHPPLYYVLMAPVMKVTEALPLVTQVFVLRLVSYLLAFAGLMIGWRATRAETLPEGVADGYLFFPLIVPMFFGEFARIGGDALCALLLGVAFSLTFPIFYRHEPSRKSAFALGICLGLGLLTKAFFLPVLASYACLLALRLWRARRRKVEFRQWIAASLFVLVPAVVLGGEWYVYELFVHGSSIGSFETVNLAQQGGLITNLRQNFSFYEFARQMTVLLVSWSWGGSWSLTRISPLLHLPLLALTGWIVVSYLNAAWRNPAKGRAWLPAWLVVPMFGGLVYHILVSIALGAGGTPGWYLNILAPFFALATGLGIARIDASAAGRRVLGVSLIYAAIFLLAVIWSQIALVTGCAIKSEEKYYQFSGHLFCLDHLPTVFDRLSVVAWPVPAFICIGAGFICLAVALRPFFAGHVDRGEVHPEAPFMGGERAALEDAT